MSELTDSQSRRTFLKTSSKVAVAAGLAPPSVARRVATRQEQEKKGAQALLSRSPADSLTIENAEMRLVLGASGLAQSLVHKPSGQECLQPETRVPAFAASLHRWIDPYYPTEARRHLPANSVRRAGDRLIVGFERTEEEVVIGLTVTEAYLGFTVEAVIGTGPSDDYVGLGGEESALGSIEEVVFLQLPVRDRVHFGEWLNVTWDEAVATCVLATGPSANIDAGRREGCHLLWARATSEVKMEGTGAALITTQADRLLDRVAQVEDDFDLPSGARSRRREEYAFSYYWAHGAVTPQTIDWHLAYARQGGFRLFMMSWWDLAKTAGHFPWLPAYPNELRDLRAVVRKVKAAGLTPGLHLHYNKADKEDPYVKGGPDPRLHLRRLFTLAAPLSEEATTITVEENPRGATLDEERRFLKVGDELIIYEGYTRRRPYQFTGCERGRLGSQPTAQEAGLKMGVLDVDTWTRFVRFDQRTSIQDEVAARIGEIYNEAGFEFVYYDGAEDVHAPYWFWVSEAQRRVHRRLEPAPLFAEGALTSHVGWHIVSRGNAGDLQKYRPEELKAATRKGPAVEAPRLAENFTAVNFGWLGYDPPGEETVGTQPDMIEYSTSRAAAWESPTSVWMYLERLEAHPRTPDNLEVFRRWERVRAQGWLSDAQKEALRDLKQEHTLLINEAGDFELVPYEQIPGVAGGAIRAFVFERGGAAYVVYWHTSGQARLEVPLAKAEVRLFEELGGEDVPIGESASGVVLPAGGRRYLEGRGAARGEIVRAFQEAKIRA